MAGPIEFNDHHDRMNTTFAVGQVDISNACRIDP